MRNWHSLYEVLRFPLGILFAAFCLLGIGNIIINPAFSSMYSITNEYVIASGEALTRIAMFVITNFPLLFLVRIVARKAGSAVSILSAVTGYVAFLIVTMYFCDPSLTSTAYSSILGLGISNSVVPSLAGSTHYPLQTGIVATALVSLITLSSYSKSRQRSDYGFFAFIPRDGYCVLRTLFWSIVAALLISFVWPYVIFGIGQVMDFIAADTTNPINLVLYGFLDRLFSVLNIGAMVRTPFWYGASGGSWINIAGGSVSGDVNIWTQQLAAANLNGMAGRFITPYYVINIFALPAMIWGIYSIQTDVLERRRMRLFFVAATVASFLGGTVLPLEILLFILAPILFFTHIGLFGVLFGVFQSMSVYLGMNYTGTSIITALPGTLMEFLSYITNLTLSSSLIKIAIVGGITAVIYFFMTRFYFNHMALDLFKTGAEERLVKGTIKAVGGIENIKMTQSSMARLVISVYDPSKMDIAMLKALGSAKVYETKAGYSIGYGSASTMVRKGIIKKMRASIRNVA